MSGKDENVIRAELAISWTLRVGVLICGALVAVGLLARLLHMGTTNQSSEHLIAQLMNGQAVEQLHPASSPSELFSDWQPDSIITMGLLLLIALPIIRVAMTVVIFLHERDWPFVGITLIVLSVLLAGIFLNRPL
jgi:uncharacterized membrane protein